MAVSPGHLLNGETVLRIPPQATDDETHGRVSVLNKKVRVGTWNVRSLYQAGKVRNVEAERRRLNVDILGLSEVRWPGSGVTRLSDGEIYYSGSNDPNHRAGVAVMVSKQVNGSVVGYVPLSERVMLLRLKTNYRPMNIIQVYAPTADKQDEEVEQFYDQITSLLSMTKRGEVTIVLGDWNAKVGKEQHEHVVGKFGLGEKNERGERLIQFCTEQNMFITNTFFQLPARRLYTWESPSGMARNQIDFVLLHQQFKKDIKSAQAYPGADVSSDHNPVVITLKMQFRRVRKPLVIQRIDIRKLQDTRTHERVVQEMGEIMEVIRTEQDTETAWKKWKDMQCTVQNGTVGHVQRHERKDWMTEEIIGLMEERRGLKNDRNMYREKNRVIRRKIREAKESWLEAKCREIEEAQAKHDVFTVHKKVKEFTGKKRRAVAGCLKNKDGKIILENDGKLSRWKEYVEELFDDERPELVEDDVTGQIDATTEDTEIKAEEVIYAIKAMKNGKAVGPDNLHCEFLKPLWQDQQAVEVLASFFSSVLSSGNLPSDWLRSVFVALPKKNNATECAEYRTISLMSHAVKIFLKIIHRRIYNTCELNSGSQQFGFRSGYGTREAVCALNVLAQRCRDINRRVYCCFIDYCKAFDCVRHEKLMEILESIGISPQIRRIIRNLYWNQTAVVRCESAESEETSIRRGVRQGCILSPVLFNVYSEDIFKKALNGEDGFKVDNVRISNIRYADDTVLISEDLAGLQNMLERVANVSREYGLEINIAKTKWLVVHRRHDDSVIINQRLLLNGQTIERVSKFQYLGTWFHDETDQAIEVRSRIEKARQVFLSMRNLMTRKDLKLQLRMRLVRCYVWSVLLYGMEGWTLTRALEMKLEALEMYVYRRMLKISYRDRVTNAEVLRRMGKTSELLYTVGRRKLEYYGHVNRNTEKYHLFQLILRGKIDGRRCAGRRKLSWEADLRRWFRCSPGELFSAAICKVKIALMVAKLRTERA